MTNGEKFKTAEERQSNFNKFCKQYLRCHHCILWHSARLGICRFKWLDLEYERQHKTMEEIIAELRDISTAPTTLSLLRSWEDFPTIHGKDIRRYFADLADEIEAAWNRRVK